ncbi:hypothetical protein niasHT_012546 [Heterodera trifolii]|uniref:Uncharacterized protein n=1 Tax=Heterodera trifolii TaxID=157864 RepID=A0ABD2L3E2_9BILA
MLLFGIPIVKQMDNKMPFEMAYTLKLKDSRIVRGKKFDCSFAWHLERYKLSDKYAIKEKIKLDELNSVCELELRIFNFSQMVVGRDVLSEYDTVIWVDTSIFFGSANLAKLLKPLQRGKIGPIQMPGWMYEYLPLYTNFEPNKTYKLSGNDPPQFESNFVIPHKTEQTRQLMKWYNLNY